MAQAAGSAG